MTWTQICPSPCLGQDNRLVLWSTVYEILTWKHLGNNNLCPYRDHKNVIKVTTTGNSSVVMHLGGSRSCCVSPEELCRRHILSFSYNLTSWSPVRSQQELLLPLYWSLITILNYIYRPENHILQTGPVHIHFTNKPSVRHTHTHTVPTHYNQSHNFLNTTPKTLCSHLHKWAD